MWVYVKMLQRPVRVGRADLRMARYLYAQFGGPDAEFSAGWRYLGQRYTMPTGRTKALVTDIGTEELDHLEIVGTMIYLLTRDVSPEDLERAGLGAHYTQHGRGLFYHDADGVPWMASYIQVHGDPVTDLHEDMAAEQKARSTYEHLIDLADDPDIKDTLKFLREREVVHFQRFGEALDHIHEYYENRRVFA